MYNNILNFVESKIEGFIKPEINHDYEFSYDVGAKIITVPYDYTCTIEHQTWWKKFMRTYLNREFDLCLEISDVYVFSLLHEIGHYITLDGIPPYVVQNNYNLAFKKLEQIKDAYEYEWYYRQINIERMADLWAIDFIEKYPEVLQIGLPTI